MGDGSWFSATLRFVIVNSALGKVRAEESVFLAKAADFDDAFRKFLTLGQRNECSYRNHVGEQIGKRFAEIKTLDIITGHDLHGAEVQSSPIDESDPSMTMDSPLDPASSKPTQTI